MLYLNRNKYNISVILENYIFIFINRYIYYKIDFEL